MSNISISNLRATGSDLFFDDENFMIEILENDLASIVSGMGNPSSDWCTVVIYTRLDPIGTVVPAPPVKP
jgi:hypothetical protein